MTKIHQQQLAGRVGRAISRQRIRCGLTQEEVAERLCVGNEAVSRIERGVVIPNIARLMDFAAIFSCDAAELLTEASSRPDDQATRISQLLKPLSQEDRQLIVDLVEHLAKRLAKV